MPIHCAIPDLKISSGVVWQAQLHLAEKGKRDSAYETPLIKKKSMKISSKMSNIAYLIISICSCLGIIKLQGQQCQLEIIRRGKTG
jgi:hypothetical protein